MFDLITGEVKHAPHHTGGPLFISMVAHAVVVAAVFLLTVLFVAAPIPQKQMMMAFVAAPPPPPPPPPPPAPPPPPPDAPRVEQPVPTSGDAAPVIEPPRVAPEPPPIEREVFAGVEGGVAGGVVGGLLLEAPLPPPPAPPPPPPPPPPRAPVRIGGQIKEPTLVHRVPPEYPLIGLASQTEGMVILEAVVDEEGKVERVKVLRSAGFFDQPAIDAVKQWRYSPVILNGHPAKFILTVVVTFKLQ